MLNKTSIQEFRATLRGGIIVPQDQGYDDARKAYGDNYGPLVMIKNKYDPNNLFRVNQIIKTTLK